MEKYIFGLLQERNYVTYLASHPFNLAKAWADSKQANSERWKAFCEIWEREIGKKVRNQINDVYTREGTVIGLYTKENIGRIQLPATCHSLSAGITRLIVICWESFDQTAKGVSPPVAVFVFPTPAAPGETNRKIWYARYPQQERGPDIMLLAQR